MISFNSTHVPLIVCIAALLALPWWCSTLHYFELIYTVTVTVSVLRFCHLQKEPVSSLCGRVEMHARAGSKDFDSVGRESPMCNTRLSKRVLFLWTTGEPPRFIMCGKEKMTSVHNTPPSIQKTVQGSTFASDNRKTTQIHREVRRIKLKAHIIIDNE